MSQTDFQTSLISVYRRAIASGLTLDEVRQQIEKQAAKLQAAQKREAHQVKTRQKSRMKTVPAWVRWGSVVLPLIFIGVGMFLVGSAVMPILGYYISPPEDVNQVELLAPIPSDQVLDVNPLIFSQLANAETLPSPSPVVIDTALDFTNLSNWFSSQEFTQLELQQPGQTDEYQLDVPSLEIENARVKVGGTDLAGSLIAYPGTALPGEPGAPVIFGHSVLRQFYNPSQKNPRRYTSIFSKIMTMKAGDPIYITYDNVRYTYVVQEKKEVQPEDVYILTQQYDASRLKLVTCVPEGTYLRRGVVVAQLVKDADK